MSYTYKIKTAKRFLRKWTAAQSSPVTQAAIDAQTVANTLCDIPWQEVDVSRATLPSHDAEGLDDNVTNRDSFDAAIFCAGHSGGNHRVYANAACYVVKLPDDAVGKTLESLKVRAMSDPYNAAGLRIAVHTNSTGVIPTDCATARTGIAYASGKAPRTTQTVDGTAYWYAAEETVTLSPVSGTLGKYLMVVVALENYATSRGNWLEGSGCIDGEIEITVSAEISGMDGYSERQYVVATAGNYPFLTGTNTGVKALALQANGSPLPEYKESQQTGQYSFGTLDEVLASLDGEVIDVNIMQPVVWPVSYNNSASVITARRAFQYAVIVGKFSQQSISGFPGLLIYDMVSKSLVQNIMIEGTSLASEFASMLDSDDVLSAAVVPTRCFNAYSTNSTVTATFGKFAFGVYVFLKTGAFAYNSSVMPMLFLDVDVDDYSVCGAKGPAVQYNSDVNCHGVVQGVQRLATTGDPAYNMALFYSIDTANNKVLPVTAYSGIIPYGSSVGPEMMFSASYMNSPSVSTTLYPLIQSLPSAGIAYAGTLKGLKTIPDSTRPTGTGTAAYRWVFVAYGSLSSFNEVACSRVAVVVYTNSVATVTTPNLDTTLADRISGAFSLNPQNAFGYDDVFSEPTPGVYLVAKDGAVFRCFDDGRMVAVAGLSNKFIATASEAGGIVYYGQTTTASPAGYDPAKLDTAGALNADASIGLRSLYAKLYGGELDNIAVESSGMSLRPGAGFVVKGATLTLPTTDGDSTDVFLWQIACAYMVLPFAAPRDFHVSKIRLAWSSLTSTRGTLAVWLKRGAFVSDAPDLKDPAFFLASKGEIDGWELVGTVDPTANSIDFAIDPIEDLTATLMFTACASMDDVNPTNATTLPQGVATGLSVDPVTKAVSGTSGTWQPSVTLVE